LKQEGAMDSASCLPSRPARGAWIETSERPGANHPPLSRPARGAWIETWPMENP